MKKWCSATWSFASQPSNTFCVLKYPFQKIHFITWNHMNPSFNPLSTPEAIFHPCQTSFSSDENSPAATYTYMSIYINPEPIALLNFNGFNLTENVWNFVWIFHEILFEIHAQQPRKKQPIKSSKNRFDICTGDFFPAPARRALFLVQYLLLLCWACSMRLLHFIFISVYCLPWAQNWESVYVV